MKLIGKNTPVDESNAEDGAGSVGMGAAAIGGGGGEGVVDRAAPRSKYVKWLHVCAILHKHVTKHKAHSRKRGHNGE